VVVVTDVWNKKWLCELNDLLRSKGHGFIWGHSSGLFGSTFVDFGDNFFVHDANGEEVKSAVIAGITRETVGIVSIHEDKRHGF
jgi:ubiquitin-activating enzyme E1